MNVVPLSLPEVLRIEPDVFGDDRGFFMETWSKPKYEGAGIAEPFVQDNLSRSCRGVIRGLHLQNPHAQGKLIHAIVGEIFDVAVDVRVGSPTFGRWVGETLSSRNKHQLYIPPGFAHGFCVVSEDAVVAYKATDVYHPEAEVGVVWNDPDIGVQWPVAEAIVSDKDRRHPKLRDIPAERLPRHVVTSAD